MNYLCCRRAMLVLLGFILLLPGQFAQALLSHPTLMIKLPGSTQTRSFINGAWTEPEEFGISQIGLILSLCADGRKIAECWSHSDGILENGVHDSPTKANLIVVRSLHEEELGDMNFVCATTWSGFGLECMEHSLEGCLDRLPNTRQEAFMCAQIERKKDLVNFFKAFYGTIHSYTLKGEEKNTKYVGGFLDLDVAYPEFSNRTGLKVVFQRPVKGAPNQNKLMSDILEDGYEHFAEIVSSHMMVRTCSDKSANVRIAFHGLGDPMMFNVFESFHPMFEVMHEGKECVDNTKLAFSIPINKRKDNFYVCFGDLPRDDDGMISGGGLYCWIDKKLNLDLRCNSVPGPLMKEVYSSNISLRTAYMTAIFDEDEYSEWYSDCPEELKRPIMDKLKEMFKLVKVEYEKAKLRNFEEL